MLPAVAKSRAVSFGPGNTMHFDEKKEILIGSPFLFINAGVMRLHKPEKFGMFLLILVLFYIE